jgi:hypothetical protein
VAPICNASYSGVSNQGGSWFEASPGKWFARLSRKIPNAKKACKWLKWQSNCLANIRPWVQTTQQSSPQKNWKTPKICNRHLQSVYIYPHIFFSSYIWDRVLLYSPSCPPTCDPPASVSWMLGLQVCTTMPGPTDFLITKWIDGYYWEFRKVILLIRL